MTPSPGGFDIDGARKAGYGDDDIIGHLTKTRKFDVEGATKAGYSKQDIIGHLASTPIVPVSKDPTTNSANAALAGSGLSVNPPDPIGGAKAQSIWNVRKDAPGMAPTAPPAIPPRGFWQSAIDQVNPIPAVKDYVTNGPNLVRGGNTLFQPRMGKDPKTGLPTPSHEFGPGPEDVPFPMGEGPGSSLLGQAAQPLQTAGGQVAEGNYLGGAGTLVGGYGVPAAAAAIAPTVARYAPPMAKGALAGAAEEVQGYKPTMATHYRMGALGAALGELSGVPHGWGYGIVAGELLPPAYAAVKGAIKGAAKGFAEASPSAPRTPPAWQAIPDRPPSIPQTVDPIPPPTGASGIPYTPSGRPRGGDWMGAPEPPAVLPTETAIPLRVEDTTPPATTPVPEQTSSPSTLETQLRDTKAYVDEHGELPKAKSIDPADQIRRQQAADEAHMANRRDAVDRAVTNLESAGLTKEQIAKLDPYQVMRDAGYKQKTLDPNTEQMYYERLGIGRKMPSQAETVMQAVKTGAIPESLLKTGTGGPATPITTPTASGLPASVRATGRPPSPGSTNPVETPTPTTRSYKRGAMRDSAAEKQIMELVSSGGNDAFGWTGAGEPLPQILPVLRSKMPKLTDAQFERVVASLADKQKLWLHPADTQIDPHAIAIGGKKYIAVSLR